MREWVIYLTGEQLSLKGIILAVSSQQIQPTPCHCVNSPGIPLGLAGHLGFGYCRPSTRPGPGLPPHHIPIRAGAGNSLISLLADGKIHQKRKAQKTSSLKSTTRLGPPNHDWEVIADSGRFWIWEYSPVWKKNHEFSTMNFSRSIMCIYNRQSRNPRIL